MIRVLIVDDEYYFRQALKISLDWNALGFEICGEENNGRNALEKIEILQPDIALVDINMPVMDGLEFTRNLRQMGKDIKVLILTGYSEFDYARQAVELGVNNYILKPIDEEELKRSLLEIKLIIEDEQQRKFEVEHLKKQANENKPLLKEKFMNELILGKYKQDSSEIMQKASYLEIDLNYRHYLVATIDTDWTNKSWPIKDRELWKFAVLNIVNEVMSSAFFFTTCFDSSERICIIIGTHQDIEQEKAKVVSKCNLILSHINKYLDFRMTIGIGNACSGIDSIDKSYNESIFCLKNKLTQGCNKVIPYDTVESAELFADLLPAERSNLLMSMRLDDTKGTTTILSKIFAEFSSKNVHPEIIYATCVELISLCLEFIAECKQDPRTILENVSDLFTGIYDKISLEELESFMQEIMVQTIRKVGQNKNTYSKKLVLDIKDYITNTYQSAGMRIDDIARHFYLNYQYICYLFKTETNYTLNEYITEFRLNKAKELIDSGKHSINSVASLVGYEDANYFSKCFKKHFGLSPSKYMET